MKTYVAIQRGYIGRLIEPGETFQYEGKPGLWMKPVAEEKSAEKAEGKSVEKSADKQATDDKAAEKADEKSADKKAANDKAAGKGGK
jgi:hypothetical protein